MENTIYVIASLLTASVTAVTLKLLIPKLKEYKIGQTILKEGPRWHSSKEGTPTMGGIAFGAVIPLIFLLSLFIIPKIANIALQADRKQLYSAAAALAYAAVCGICGATDDLCKLKRKANQGLKAWQKYLFLLIATVVYLWFMASFCGLETELTLPFADIKINLGSWYWIFAAILLTGTVNAVNLTDGIDGLCASVSAAVCLFFFALSLYTASAYQTALSCIGFGGCMGFLVYNCHPAKIFMGDTGSLFLGGLISGLAFSLGSPLLLFLIGIVYMLEAFSVILQVAVFKLTGKRVFKMAPFHHHLEKSGWSEKKIVRAATILTSAVAIICIILLSR